MKGTRKDMLKELNQLKDSLRQLLRKNAEELGRTRALLRERERQIIARLATLDSMETMREEISKRLRTRPPGSEVR